MNLSEYLPFLVDLLAKGLVVSAVAFLAAWLLRRSSAARRHLIWACMAGVLLALPIVESGRLLAARWSPSDAGTGTVVVVRIPALSNPGPSAEPAVSSTGAAPVGRKGPWDGGQTWRAALVGVWGCGVLLGLAGTGMAMRRFREVAGRSSVLTERSILKLAEDLAREAGVRRRVVWRVSVDAPVAMTWGWWRPVVLLPHAAAGWSRERLELVLRHEIAHVERGDSFVRFLAGVACVLHWPNPLVWAAARHLRLAQEQACDDAVLRAGGPAEDYAEELLAGARAWGGRSSPGGVMAMAEPSTLELRIRGVLGAGRREATRRPVVIGAWAAAGCLLAGCSTVKVGEGEVAARPVPAPVDRRQVQVEVRRVGQGEAAGRSVSAPMDRRQVQVEVRFVELKGRGATSFDAATFFGGALLPDDVAGGAMLGHLRSEDASRLLRELSARSGGQVLSAPRVTVLNGNRATIAVVGEELRYPSTFDAPPDEKTKFESRGLGVEASVSPTLRADGRVALEVRTMVRDFEGYLGGPPAAGAATAGEAAEILVPIFVERADSALVVLRPGEIAVLRASGKKKVLPDNAPNWARDALAPEAGEDSGVVLIFVGATVVPKDGTG